MELGTYIRIVEIPDEEPMEWPTFEEEETQQVVEPEREGVPV